MNQFEHFTSLPPNEEQTFVVYERRTVEARKKAMTIGLITSGLVFLFTVIVVLSFEPPKNLMADDDMGMLDRSSGFDSEEEAKPASKPAEKPAAEAASEGDSAEAGDSGDSAESDGDAE